MAYSIVVVGVTVAFTVTLAVKPVQEPCTTLLITGIPYTFTILLAVDVQLVTLFLIVKLIVWLPPVVNVKLVIGELMLLGLPPAELQV